MKTRKLHCILYLQKSKFLITSLIKIKKMRPLLVLDLELSGCGRHKEKNRIIAIGACVISPQYIVQKLTSPNVVFSPEDIPEKYKFLRYIHDKEALEEVKDLENPGPIWHEPAGSSFWFKQTH